jgi:hypothetical protein
MLPLILFVLLLTGCEHVDDNEDTGCVTPYVASDYPASTVSYQADIVPILANNSCNSEFCHGNPDAPPSNFSVLSAESLFGPGNEAAQLETCNIIRGNPDQSYVVKKLMGTATIGERMPLGGDPIPTADLASIRQWIVEGAPDN